MANIEELLEISSVLTVDYLSQKLSDWFGKDIKYTGHEFGDGTGKGDSYLSDVYRITFNGMIVSPKPGENPEVAIKAILKTFPKNIARRNTFRSSDFFRNEINFYEIILPRFMEFQATKKMTSPFNHCPKIFASTTNGKSDFLALEDMTIYNFGGAVRQEGIDYPHCQMILESFAKFHALSFAFKDQNPEEYEKFVKCVPEVYYAPEHWNWYKGFWKSLCAVSIDAVEKELPNSKYLDKIKEFATDKTYIKMSAAANAHGKSAVISHGDSWTPNFLFKYKEGTTTPLAAKMIDFQLSRSASPVLDVSFFIYACSSEKLRAEYYDKMLKYYYDILANQIKEMGSDPNSVYSWDDFMAEIKKYSYFGLGFSMESTPVIILDPEDAFDMEAIQGTETFRIEEVWTLGPIKSQAGRQRLTSLVVHAVDHGYI